MVIQPKIKGFICTTAHPVGCDANVKAQIDYVKQQPAIEHPPKRVLVIGSSTGYGLASRITAAFGCGASTIGLFFEKPASGKRTASAGWYNSAAFQKYADEAGLYSKNINGDAFSHEIKQKTIDLIKEDWGQVDLVIYSLASPRRTDPDTGETYSSVLKPIGAPVTQTGVNTDKETVQEFTLEAANQDEIDNTVKVMGGADWELWIKALSEAGVLAPDCQTSAYTYVGEQITRNIYWDGTIGAAKKDLDKTAARLNQQYNVQAVVSVLKAVVTQSSSAIPVMPLYLALLFKVMKEAGTDEGCIEQIYRLFAHRLYAEDVAMDSEGRFRVDEHEVKADIQQAVAELWDKITTDNLHELSDYNGFRTQFLQLFGFENSAVDYAADVEAAVDIANLL